MCVCVYVCVCVCVCCTTCTAVYPGTCVCMNECVMTHDHESICAQNLMSDSAVRSDTKIGAIILIDPWYPGTRTRSLASEI